MSKKKKRAKLQITAYLMVVPALLGVFIFIVLPFFMAFILSFTNLRLGSPLPVRFVFFENYYRIFQNDAFLRALLNNGLFTIVVVPLQTGLALLLAIVLNSKLKGISIYRTLFFMPVVFPMSLVAIVWQLIYAPGINGSLNSALGFLSGGLIAPQDYLRNEWLALPAIMLLSIWQGLGFQMVILLAGLQSIPKHLYEAASIDGASWIAQFKFITIPQLRNPLTFTALVTSILAFRIFDQVQIMTQGGPNKATTTVMFEAVRTVFDRQQVGLASAMTVIFFIIVLILTFVQKTLLKQEREIF